MFRLFSIQYPSFAPGDSNTPAKEELTVESMIDFMSADEEEEVIDIGKDKTLPKEEKEIKVDDEKEEKEEDEIDELKEIEDELEGPSDDKLELTTPVRRREILQKYPKLFEDFPYLEKAYYREQQFTEIFPTIDDARLASQRVEELSRFESKILTSGNTEDILKAVKQEDENSFNKVVDNYMVALFNTDQGAYHHVIGNIAKTTIASMVQEGKEQNNEALISAAAILNQYIFGTGKYTPPTRLARQDGQSQDRDNVSKERQQFVKERFDVARDDLSSRLGNSLKSTIDQNIDKNKSMTDYVRKNATREAYETLERLIEQDTRFQSLKDRLWTKAFEENFSKSALDRIRSAYVSKAKTLLPTVIKKTEMKRLGD